MRLLERASPKKGATKPLVHPTPIRISKRTAIVVALAILATLMLVLWAVPSAPTSVVGGFGLARRDEGKAGRGKARGTACRLLIAKVLPTLNAGCRPL
jgi:hypothetical protein